ncbi:hypothetical protein [Rubritalea marina]|nr:hypothetical protein [Rubritalea marina]
MKSCLFFFLSLGILGALGLTIGYNYLVNADTSVIEENAESKDQ